MKTTCPKCGAEFQAPTEIQRQGGLARAARRTPEQRRAEMARIRRLVRDPGGWKRKKRKQNNGMKKHGKKLGKSYFDVVQNNAGKFVGYIWDGVDPGVGKRGCGVWRAITYECPTRRSAWQAVRQWQAERS